MKEEERGNREKEGREREEAKKKSSALFASALSSSAEFGGKLGGRVRPSTTDLQRWILDGTRW